MDPALTTTRISHPKSFLFPYLMARWLPLLVATLMAVLLGAVSALVFSLIGPALNVLMSPDPQEQIRIIDLLGGRLGGWITGFTGRQAFSAALLWQNLPLMLVVTAGLRALLSQGQWYLWENAGEQVSRDLRRDLLGGWFRQGAVPRSDDEAAMSSAVTTDIRLTREYLIHFYGGLPREVILAGFYMVTLYLLSSQLFLFFFLGILPALVILRQLGRKLRRRTGAALDEYSGLTEWIQQRLMGLETIKHYGTEKRESARLRELTRVLYERFYAAARVKARTSPLLEVVAVGAMVGILYLALAEVRDGTTSGAVQLSFFSTLAVLSQSVAKLARYYNSFRIGEAAIERIRNLFSAPGQEPPGDRALLAGGPLPDDTALAMKQVTVTYGGEPALADFSFIFRRARFYAIAGPSGAGKSTLMRTVLGLVPARAGVLNRGAEQPGYVPQDLRLAPDSIAANVSWPTPGPEPDRVKEALQRVGLWDFVDQLPAGASTRVGAGGRSLSGGQAQRVLLSRLFYHRFRLVLVDEGTSALDPGAENLVLQCLRDLVTTGTTVIMIAHRRTTMHAADELLYIEKGRLILSGLPEKVLQSVDISSGNSERRPDE